MLVVFLGTTDYTKGDYERAQQRFTGGVKLEEVVRVAEEMESYGIKALINCLGEDSYQSSNLYMYKQLSDMLFLKGILTGISIKPTSMGLTSDWNLAFSNIIELCGYCTEHGQLLEIDMESKDYVDGTIEIAKELLSTNQVFRLAVQTGLRRTKQDVKQLIQIAEHTGNIGFRIVTGSCYEKNGNGYKTTLEQSESDTDETFHELIEITHEHWKQGGLKSAVGTFVIKRLYHAAYRDLELQGLMGYDNLDGQKLLMENSNRLNVAVYVPFGFNKSYLKRRLDSQKL